jgi:hypothetical protein
MQEAVDLRRELAGLIPAAYLPDLEVSLSNLARLLRNMGRRAEALAASLEAFCLRLELVSLNCNA